MSVSTAIPLEGAEKQAKIYSLQDYLKRENTALHKHEFYNGQIIRMPGGTFKHNEIANNIATALRQSVKNLEIKYRVTNSDQKIYIPSLNIALYPDALVVFEKPEFWQNSKSLITNPLLIVEVASKSTKNYDRGEKFMHYRTLPSFKEYVLIEQNETKVEVWFRERENSWLITTETDLAQNIVLQSLKVAISMADIYENTDNE